MGRRCRDNRVLSPSLRTLLTARRPVTAEAGVNGWRGLARRRPCRVSTTSRQGYGYDSVRYRGWWGWFARVRIKITWGWGGRFVTGRPEVGIRSKFFCLGLAGWAGVPAAPRDSERSTANISGLPRHIIRIWSRDGRFWVDSFLLARRAAPQRGRALGWGVEERGDRACGPGRVAAGAAAALGNRSLQFCTRATVDVWRRRGRGQEGARCSPSLGSISAVVALVRLYPWCALSCRSIHLRLGAPDRRSPAYRGSTNPLGLWWRVFPRGTAAVGLACWLWARVVSPPQSLSGSTFFSRCEVLFVLCTEPNIQYMTVVPILVLCLARPAG